MLSACRYIRQSSSTCSSAVVEWVPRPVVSPDGFEDSVSPSKPRSQAAPSMIYA